MPIRPRQERLSRLRSPEVVVLKIDRRSGMRINIGKRRLKQDMIGAGHSIAFKNSKRLFLAMLLVKA